MQEKLDKMLDKIDIGKENCTDMVVFTGDSQDQEQARQPLSKGQGSSDNLESEVKREMDMPQHVTLKILFAAWRWCQEMMIFWTRQHR